MAISIQSDAPVQNPKNSKVKNTQKHAIHSSQADVRLFQQLGNDMADRLINKSHTASESLNLVDRLNSAHSETILATTTTVTTKTTKEQVQIESAFLSVNYSAAYSSPDLCHSIPTKYKRSGTIFTLDDFAAIGALESLAERYGRVSHMGILDKSYSFFVTKARDAALYFKVKNHTAIVGGDPLCEPHQFPAIMAEFKEYRKQFGWGIAILGATNDLAQYATEQKWVTMHFGTERVLNPVTNPVLLEKAGKRIVSQNKQLLDPERGATTLDVYIPSQGKKPQLQEQLVNIYNDWRDHRNRSGKPQAYMTIYDPFALPDLMTYIFTTNKEGLPNGFAALRKLGAHKGYHIDPCIAAPEAPRGISDLLIFSAMALLNKAGISYLSLGFEPMQELGEITGMSKPIAKITRSAYRHSFQGLPIGGKKDYHDKFRPDEEQQSNLHLVYPEGVGLRHAAALMHIANISVGRLIAKDMSRLRKLKEDTKDGGDNAHIPAVA